MKSRFEVELLLRAREALSANAPQRPLRTGFHRSLEQLTALFARHVDAQETTLFPRCVERLDAMTFQKIMEDVSIASFRLAASARLRALRASAI